MQHLLRRAAPALAPGLLLATSLLPLLSPQVVLTERDLPIFHLPLRAAWTAAWHLDGLPEWNPLLNGGQPILSNPNYASFYPPSWLALVVPVHYALNLLVVLHAAWAAWGAWTLLRRLAAPAGVAAAAACSWAGGTWFLGLSSTLNFYVGLSWLPWLAVWARDLLQATDRLPRRPFVLAAAGVALQLLAGEPVSVLASATLLACIALSAPCGMPRAVARLALAAALAALLSAVQLVPTLARLAESTRAPGLSLDAAAVWSGPPARLFELVFPRLFGDLHRDEEGLYFGWGVHDRNYPYVLSLYCGLPTAVLAFAALAAWPIPWRRSLWAALAAGLFFGLGRHNPAFPWLFAHLAPLRWVRYPEKFLVLVPVALAIAGALGLAHLDHEARAGRRGRAHLPAALALLAALVAGTWLVLLLARPALGEWFVLTHSGLPPSPDELARAIGWVRQEAAMSGALALLLAAALLLARFPRTVRWTVPAVLALLVADLAWAGRHYLPTLPSAEVLAPPAAARLVLADEGRVFTDVEHVQRPAIFPRTGRLNFSQTIGRLERLDPYYANLWGIGYALHADFDWMLTAWARHGLDVLHAVWPRRPASDHLLASWNVSHVLFGRRPEPMAEEFARTGVAPSPVRVVVNPLREPLFRSPPRVALVPDAGAALAWARTALEAGAVEACVGEVELPSGMVAAEVLGGAWRARRAWVAYRSTAPALVVAAATYDVGWEARLAGGGTALTTCPTALGQLAVLVPAGEHRVELAYRDPWVRVGAATTAIALLGLGLVAVARARRPPP